MLTNEQLAVMTEEQVSTFMVKNHHDLWRYVRHSNNTAKNLVRLLNENKQQLVWETLYRGTVHAITGFAARLRLGLRNHCCESANCLGKLNLIEAMLEIYKEKLENCEGNYVQVIAMLVHDAWKWYKCHLHPSIL